MIRLIIVEDEQMIRNGISKYTPWKELGIDEIRTALNAEAAWDICENFQPDIILSDIRMPGINGIDLCMKLRKKLPNIQIIFISGFSDKEYLMSAIKLGAVNYIEKPISIEILSAAITKAVVAVRKLSYQKTSLLHALLCLDPFDERNRKKEKSLVQNDDVASLKCDGSFWIGILLTRQEARNMEDFGNRCRDTLKAEIGSGNFHFAVDPTGLSTIVIFFSAENQPNSNDKEVEGGNAICTIILRTAKQSCGDCFLGIGKCVKQLNYLSDSYQTAVKSIQSLSYKGWNQYAFSDEKRIEYKKELSEEALNVFYKSLLNGNQQQSQNFINHIYHWLIQNHVVLNFHVRNLYFQIECEIFRAGRMEAHPKINMPKLPNSLIEKAQTIQEMHDYINRQVVLCCQEAKEERKNNAAIITVLKYLNEKPEDKSISIQMLADMVYLTPAYLSCIFKKRVGLTIGQVLTKARIEKAKRCLENPKLKLYQIADMAGYEDANYFSKIFKKKTGLLPSEYRESKL